MSIQQQEQEVFRDWKKSRTPVIEDGVVDEPAYCKSSPKVLFVLKEANDPNGGGWRLSEAILNETIKPTWDNIALWVYGIRNLDQDLPWEDASKWGNQSRSEVLKGIAAMNLKKNPGGHTTNTARFEKIVIDDWEFIYRQFVLYNADLMICCGSTVEWGLNYAFERENNKLVWRHTTRGVRFAKTPAGGFIVSHVHPEARVPDHLKYYGIVDACREIMLPTLHHD